MTPRARSAARQMRHLVVRAAQLEREHRLLVLALQQDAVAEPARQRRRELERRLDRDVVDLRGQDLLQVVDGHRSGHAGSAVCRRRARGAATRVGAREREPRGSGPAESRVPEQPPGIPGRAPPARPRCGASSAASARSRRAGADPRADVAAPRRRRAARAAAPCRSSASPGRASSRDRPRPAAARRAARRAPTGAHCRRRSARTARRGCCACPGNISRASASVSISARVDARRTPGARRAASSASRKPMSNGALWMIHSAPRANSTNSAATSRNLGLPLRSSQVIPCTSVAPASISRSGSTRKCTVRPVARRSTTSSAANSMIRWPCFGSSPVVSVSMMIWRMRVAGRSDARSGSARRACAMQTGRIAGGSLRRSQRR